MVVVVWYLAPSHLHTPGSLIIIFLLLRQFCTELSIARFYFPVVGWDSVGISALFVHLFPDNLEQMSIWGRGFIDLEPWWREAWGMGRAESCFIWRNYVLSESIKHCAKHINVPRWPPSSLISRLFCLRPHKQTAKKEGKKQRSTTAPLLLLYLSLSCCLWKEF